MADINPIARLYDDIMEILRTMTIKYSCRADALETLETKSNASKYLLAYDKKDKFLTYDDYTAEEYLAIDPALTESDIRSYMNDLTSVPVTMQAKLLVNRREYITSNYVELNNYYRMLNGLPNLDEKYALYKVSDYDMDICEKYNIPKDIYIHEVEDKLGKYYIDILSANGVIDKIIEANSDVEDAEYLQHLGEKRIAIALSRNSKNFEILYIDDKNLMESTYREFLYVYGNCREYFMSTAYTFEYRGLISRYDNFIALCIFVMTVQQLSVRSIPNAVDREFYDSRAIQLLYETYGLPFNGRIDDLTQKQIVQNVNLLIQNKASDKVILDIASILGFTNIEVYEYYLMKERMFDKNGRPIFRKKKVFNINTGEYEEVYDYESMYDIYFQRVAVGEDDVHSKLMDPLNRVNYYDVVYYDPYWWEDDDLKKEIWQKEYNIMETKYLGLTIPYRMTEMIFQSVYLLRMIEDKSNELNEMTISLPKVTENEVPLIDVIMFMCAMMAKKYYISGDIYSMPSQVLHILEVLDQDIYKEEGYNEVLGFDFDMFKLEPEEDIYRDDINKTIWRKRDDGLWHEYTMQLDHLGCNPMSDEEIEEKAQNGRYTKEVLSRLKKTTLMLENYLKQRKYIVMNHHDVDVNRDTGIQDTFAPTHLVDFDIETEDYEEFMSYIMTLSTETLGTTNEEKRNALNALFKDMKKLYHFLSYRLSVTQDLKEYYAIQKFYQAAFYTREVSTMFHLPDPEDGDARYTYMDYLKDNNKELYDFMCNMEYDEIYVYMEHVIYRLETVLDDIGLLYQLNDQVSPLQELLIQLVDFFRSYTTDLIDFASVMIVDWRMENMMKLIDHPQYLHKVDVVKDDILGTSYGDFLKKFMVKFSIDDQMKLLHDHTSVRGSISLHDTEIYEDDIHHISAKEKIKDTLTSMDSIKSIRTGIEVNDNFSFADECIIVRK